MRIVLQHSKTGMYLKSLNRWTPNATEALAFLDTVRAHDYSVYHRLSETVIIPIPEGRGYTTDKAPVLAAAAQP